MAWAGRPPIRSHTNTTSVQVNRTYCHPKHACQETRNAHNIVIHGDATGRTQLRGAVRTVWRPHSLTVPAREHTACARVLGGSVDVLCCLSLQGDGCAGTHRRPTTSKQRGWLAESLLMPGRGLLECGSGFREDRLQGIMAACWLARCSPCRRRPSPCPNLLLAGTRAGTRLSSITSGMASYPLLCCCIDSCCTPYAPNPGWDR